MSSLPETHRALVLTSRDKPLTVQHLPSPQPVPGTAIIKIVATSIVSYAGDVYSGKRPYPFPTPLVPGLSAIGRVAAVGPDSTSLKQDQLVLVEGTIRSRDDPGDVFLLGVMEGYSDGSRHLMKGEWRDGTWAEYAKIPLENCFPLNETRLIHDLGYTPEVLTQMISLTVPHGGLADIDVKAGETIIVTPATGPFGSAAVRVAVALGARVIAMGRNQEGLAKLQSSLPAGRVITVPLSEHAENDAKELAKYGPIDAYFDISPPAAQGSHYLSTCIKALRHSGRVSLMGGLRDDVPLPHSRIVHNNILLRGTWMSSAEQIRRLIKLVENGLLGLGSEQGWKLCGRFALEDWQAAFDAARDNARPGQYTVFVP